MFVLRILLGNISRSSVDVISGCSTTYLLITSKTVHPKEYAPSPLIENVARLLEITELASIAVSTYSIGLLSLFV